MMRETAQRRMRPGAG